ncbi:MAG: exonuclease domain-containing protein [Bacteroidales bacterium]|nr:exonuclease domain-containing protein [Bacteroidales bacterium]
MYAIIDVETTGVNAKSDRLTEIAIIIFDGEKIVKEFSSLINPECKIPYRITQMTGINNKMVENAPKFYELAKDIVEITEGVTFVAHNAAFDYRFIRAEFESLGYNFERKTLDTIKLARKFIPGLRSYSLGNLCADIGIEINNRHRAMGDAQATTELFKRIYQYNPDLDGVSLKGLHFNLTKEKIDSLPQETGVYYFYNDNKELIYVGKSTNIHSRIISHLNNTTSKKALEMKNRIADVDYELCGSDLVALLLESDEIKKNLPIYNRAQRRSLHTWGLYFYENEEGYSCFTIERAKNTTDTPLTLFSSKIQAQEQLFLLTENYELCQKLNGLYHNSGACFQYGIKLCKGACIGKENTEDYNLRVDQIKNYFSLDHDNLILVDKGRSKDEKAIVIIEEGSYRGFGYVDENVLNQLPEVIKSGIINYVNNRDTQSIIRSYLRRKKVEQIIYF